LRDAATPEISVNSFEATVAGVSDATAPLHNSDAPTAVGGTVVAGAEVAVTSVVVVLDVVWRADSSPPSSPHAVQMSAATIEAAATRIEGPMVRFSHDCSPTRSENVRG
jgi:hypothetical protein